jgi:hypothetical protein
MLNGYLHYHLPADIDKPLNDAAAEKIREYRADYNNRSCNSISLMPAIASTTGCLHCELVSILFFWLIGKPTPLLCSFRSSARATQPGPLPFPPRCFLRPAQI